MFYYHQSHLKLRYPIYEVCYYWNHSHCYQKPPNEVLLSTFSWGGGGNSNPPPGAASLRDVAWTAPPSSLVLTAFILKPPPLPPYTHPGYALNLTYKITLLFVTGSVMSTKQCVSFFSSLKLPKLLRKCSIIRHYVVYTFQWVLFLLWCIYISVCN